MRRLTDILLATLIPLLTLLYLLLAPYTKVEESFNIQATHDILTSGIPWGWDACRQLRARYDHLTFTGPVPRTFVGPLVLAGGSWPVVRLGEVARGWGTGRRGEQVIVRAVLGLFNAYCMISFRGGVAKAFGRNAANWYSVFQAGQFHMMYYASRTLPNFFAFGLTTLAMKHLLPYAGRSPGSRATRRRYKSALTVLTTTGIIFRSEVALLLACHTIYLYLQPRTSLQLHDIVSAGLKGALLGLILTIPIDTYFWQSPTPLWPELSGFIFNILHGESSNWGVQPFYFYFASSLPRLLFNPFIYQVCLPFALSISVLRASALDILLPNVLFVAIYSYQPHKEWRFIIYIIPPLLAVASAGASWIWTRRAKSFVYRVLSLALVASTLASFMASAGMLAMSRLNYPGGEALARLHDLARNNTGVVRVHMDALACMTGVTRFLEKIPPVLEEADAAFWMYDKTEDEEKLLDPLFWQGVDYALAEHPERVIGSWEVLDVVNGYAGVRVVRSDESLGDGKTSLPGWTDVAGPLKGVLREGLNSKDLQGVKTWMENVLSTVETLVRRHVTRGWWVEMTMEPRIRILKRSKRSNIVPEPL